jgi:ABC-type multidrug transport system fused ATPase/permease subunit
MQSAAYQRARKLLSSSRDALFARILGAVESLVVLALLTTAALLVSLLASRGEITVSHADLPGSPPFPSWSRSRIVGESVQSQQYGDSGLFPLIAGNLRSPNPVHRLAARWLDGLTGLLPPLRNNLGALATLLAAGLAFILLLSVLRQARRAAIARAVTGLTTNLRNQIHRQMYRLGQSSLPTEGVGPVVNIWTREVNDVRDALVADLDTVPRMIVLGGGLAILALMTSPILTLFLTSLGLLVWMTSRAMDRDARLAHDSALRDASVQLCLLHEDLGLLRTVRVYGVENYDRQRFDEHLERYREADARRFVTDARPSTTTALLYGAAAVAALGLLGYNVLVKENISIATMLILSASLAGLAFPIADWTRMRRAIRLAERSANEVFEFLERSTELHQNVGAEFLAPLKDHVALENVSLESRSGRTLLDNVTLEIPARARTGVMGMDEDSKLALACLIPRLIDPLSGRVRVDGRDLREMTLESVRAQVATVLQADMVFTDSILVNIGLGDPRNTLQRVIEAAKIAHAHHFIQDLPHGYDTIIGPLGHYLRPDEQLRIALARAYLHDPSILIVEEPSSPIDEEIRHLLDDTLARLGSEATLIILPHRLSTVQSCDNIILLDNARLVEVAPPAQLQAENKLFRHILYTEFNAYATGEIEAGQVPA